MGKSCGSVRSGADSLSYLFDWLVAECKAQNWWRLYWVTAETNYRARGLCDKHTPHGGFLRYVIKT